MKKTSSKVDVKLINFTKISYNNLIVNVNTDNSSSNKLKSLSNNLLCYEEHLIIKQELQRVIPVFIFSFTS